MDQKQLTQWLAESLRDRKLDGNEKQALRELLQRASPDQKRFVRNRAFDLVREALPAGDAQDLFQWLEQVSKTLDAPVSSESLWASAHFSPGAECRTAILDLLHRTRTELDICVFTLSDDRITQAVLACHQRGVAVRVITDNDKANDEGSDVDLLRKAGVPVRMDHTEFHMHHKFALFDGKWLLNGSFNWTRSASDFNQENILITPDALLVQAFAAQFERLWQQFG